MGHRNLISFLARIKQLPFCKFVIRLRGGFVYLMAVLDWFSRFVIAWELSVSLDAEFCVGGLERALKVATPEIFNTDQGRQFVFIFR
ncbi:MAG: transposase family protein [Acidobacteria bacterium]|nr:transposase family protein [Acidobacteriota bacterium]